jgi:hypothetical protein
VRLFHGRPNCLIGYKGWGMGIDSAELNAEGHILPVTGFSKGLRAGWCATVFPLNV